MLYETLQPTINVELRSANVWHCHKNGLIKMIPTVPHDQCVSFKSSYLYCELGKTKINLNPQ